MIIDWTIGAGQDAQQSPVLPVWNWSSVPIELPPAGRTCLNGIYSPQTRLAGQFIPNSGLTGLFIPKTTLTGRVPSCDS